MAGIYIGAGTLAIIILAHAIYVGYRIGQLTEAVKNTSRRVAAVEPMVEKIYKVDDLARRVDRLEDKG